MLGLSPPPHSSMCHHHFRGWRRIKSLASLVHTHFHALSKRVSQTLIAMITNEVFSCFAFYGALMVIKMYIIAIITGQVRLRRKVRV